DPGFLGEFADGRRPQRSLAFAVVAVDGATGEDPGPAHEPRGGIALHEEHLERARAAAGQDHGGGGTRVGPGARGGLFARAWRVDTHRATLSWTAGCHVDRGGVESGIEAGGGPDGPTVRRSAGPRA